MIAFRAMPYGTQRQYVNLEGRRADLPFSDGVLAGDTLYLSGRIGIDPKTGKPPAELEEEIRLLLDGIKNVLEKSGMKMDDLVYVQIFCPDVSLWERFNKAYVKYFTPPYPARAFVGSGPLLFGAHFELQAIASRAR